jgi:hypothetical protein
MQSLGFETLVTTLLPGTILLLAVFFAAVPPQEWDAVLASLEAHDTLLTVGLLLVAALLGTILASLMSVLEWQVYDRVATRVLRRRMPGYSRDTYLAEWNNYLDSLETKKNPFVDRMVLYLFFESRTAVALLLLAWALCRSAHPDNPYADYWYWPGLIGAFLLLQSFFAHYELASFRHRRYPA